MADDLYALALCRIDGLSAEQLDGIEVLCLMNDDEVTAFVDACDAAWEANRKAVGESIAAINEAISRYREVETRVANAARQRNAQRPILSQDEREACDEALAAYGAALDAHEAAKTRFKAGITQAQLEALL